MIKVTADSNILNEKYIGLHDECTCIGEVIRNLCVNMRGIDPDTINGITCNIHIYILMQTVSNGVKLNDKNGKYAVIKYNKDSLLLAQNNMRITKLYNIIDNTVEKEKLQDYVTSSDKLLLKDKNSLIKLVEIYGAGCFHCRSIGGDDNSNIIIYKCIPYKYNPNKSLLHEYNKTKFRNYNCNDHHNAAENSQNFVGSERILRFRIEPKHN